MPINSVGIKGNIKPVSTTFAKQTATVKQAPQAKAPAKADSAYISEKAKDLAAKQDGKSSQEEAQESNTTRLKEGKE